MIKKISYNFGLLKCLLLTLNTIRKYKNITKNNQTDIPKLNNLILSEKNFWSKRILEIGNLEIIPDFSNYEKNENQKLYIINHRSMLDIPIIQKCFIENENEGVSLNWIAKKELFNIKVIGDFFKYSKTLEIDRENKRSIISLLKHIKFRKAEDLNQNFAIFPEGTRNKTEELLLEFKDGASLIAKKNNLDIIPVYIKERSDLIEQNLKNMELQKINVIFGKKISDLDNLEKEYQDFVKEVRERD